MKLNEIIHGFRVKSVERVEEHSADMYLMEHEKSGAKLCFMDREDECKTFAIAFRTIPEDSTGVFHILEHSVLCGSEKFPIKEPFTELLKGSLNSFLNAMTYSDRTAYPVSSRNDKDFLNLMNVYLDATLHPNAIKNENIFRQEGWRYEVGEDGENRINGVVYNEMKGASTVDEYLDDVNEKLMFPGSCYSHNSGGDPEVIPTLTYEQFKAAHAKFYHPSNSYIVLDGSVNLEDALSLIDSYLRDFDRKEVVIDRKMGQAPDTNHFIGEYEIENGEDLKNKTRAVLSYPLWDHSDKIRSIALSIIIDSISDTNNAPLKKAVLSHGLCENFYISPDVNSKQAYISVDFKGIKDGKEEELIAVFKDELKKLIANKVDKALITASLNSMEFRTRESDFGSYPKGIIIMSSIFENWLYGESPKEALTYEDAFKTLRENIDSDYYENLLYNVFFENPEVHITVTPSPTLSEEKRNAEKARVDEAFKKMSDEDKAKLKKWQEQFVLWQKTPDSIEDLNKLPKLEIKDLNTKITKTPQEAEEFEGATILTQPLKTGGISYVSMYFDVSDIAICDLPALSFMTFIIPELASDRSSAEVLNGKIKTHLGRLFLSPTAVEKNGKTKLYIVIKTSLLDHEKDNAIDILKEYLYSMNFDNIEEVKTKLMQLKTESEEDFVYSGVSIAASRVSARYNTMEYIKECLNGYTMHSWLKESVKNIDEVAPKLIEKMKEIYSKAFTKENLTISVTENSGDDFGKRIVSSLKSGVAVGDKYYTEKLEKRNEGIAIPSQVNYAVSGSNYLDLSDVKFTGSIYTLGNVLNYSILWNEIRVSGGAYGTGFISRRLSGGLGFYSFRDPNPKNSLSVFKKCGDLIRETLTKEDFDLTKSIIGAVRDLTPIRTERVKGDLATLSYLVGEKPNEFDEKMINEAIATDKEELARLSEIIDRASKDATYCVVGTRDKLKGLPDLDEILEI